jgi:hypothetical protein
MSISPSRERNRPEIGIRKWLAELDLDAGFAAILPHRIFGP